MFNSHRRRHPDGQPNYPKPTLAPRRSETGELASQLVVIICGTVAGGTDRHSEDDIRYTRRRYLNAEAARRIAIEIANATFAARKPSIWG